MRQLVVDSGSSRSLTDPRFRSALALMVKRRVPDSDVEDIVQSALAEAIASPNAPKGDPEALRRWIWGVARHKVVDFHRRARREEMGDPPEVPVDEAPHAERDLLRWAAEELPPGTDAERTLEWMLREGEGEKLESIAESEELPVPRVRQRVTRLRRHLRTRWAAEIAALAALGVLVFLTLWLVRRSKPRLDLVRPEIPGATVSSPMPPRPPPVMPAVGDHDRDRPNDLPPRAPTTTTTPPAVPSASGSATPTPAPVPTPMPTTPSTTSLAPPSPSTTSAVSKPPGKVPTGKPGPRPASTVKQPAGDLSGS